MTLLQLISWLFSDPTKTSPLLEVVSFVFLFIPMVASMFYLTGTLMRFVTGKIVDCDKKEKALQRPLQQRIGRNLLAWFVLAFVFGGITGSYNLPTFFLLSNRGISTSGRSLKTAKGVAAGYEFKIGQKIIRYSRLKNGEKLYPGSNVTIVYSPSNPQTSMVRPVKPRLDNELVSVGMVVLLFPATIMFLFKRSMMPRWKRALNR